MTTGTAPPRRDLIRAAGLLGGMALLGSPALAGCGGPRDGRTNGVALVAADIPRATPDPALLPVAAEAVTGFTADLYRQAARADPWANLVCSPYSVAVALAMVRAGARGRTAEELDTVLHAPGGGRLHPALNALTRAVDSRAGTVTAADGSRSEIQVDVANAVWGQRGVTWEQDFLAELARSYGTGMRQADFVEDGRREQTRRSINAWTADRTRGRITDLVPAGVLDRWTRLVLVNAMYLKAAWLTPFEQASTAPSPFRTAAGDTVQVPMMTGTGERGYLTGDGWQAVGLPYRGGQLAMAVVLPDEGWFVEVERGLDGAVLRRLLTGFRPDQVRLTMPRWRFRSHLTLNEALSALGMPTAFSAEADFSGMTTAERLAVAQVLHQGFVAVDEAGTEAAAATAVAIRAVSAERGGIQLRLDRPFLFVIHDVPTGTPLFVGRVTDPTAG